jgi:hypothetical protein
VTDKPLVQLRTPPLQYSTLSVYRPQAHEDPIPLSKTLWTVPSHKPSQDGVTERRRSDGLQGLAIPAL